MARLTITRGLPGSGKTHWARQQNAWRVNRDDTRAMLRQSWEWGNGEHEALCSAAQRGAIRALLRAGVDVIVDDTNLGPRAVKDFERIAIASRADFEVKDFTDVPLSICLARDANRAKPVGEKVILSMYDRYLRPVSESA